MKDLYVWGERKLCKEMFTLFGLLMQRTKLLKNYKEKKKTKEI
jgi:hypothetical protein